MRYLSVLSSVALAIAPTLANIQVSYFNDYDTCNNGDAADRYETIQRDIDSGNCIQGLSGYDTLSIRTTVEEEPLKQCGPFYYDSGCSQLIRGSESFDCSNCVGYTGDNVYFFVD